MIMRLVKACPECGNRELYLISDRKHTAMMYVCCPVCGHSGIPAGHKNYNEATRQAIVNWNSVCTDFAKSDKSAF